MKTLSAALIETLFLLHLKMDVVHGAAIKEQSDKCKEYIRDYFNFPILNEVAGEDNDKNFGVRRYEHMETKVAITPKEWLKLSSVEQTNYKLLINKLKIVVATVKSMNGQHSPLLCFSGDTMIMVEETGVKQKLKRTRRQSNARALYKYIQGLNPTGQRGFSEKEGKIKATKDIKVLSYNQNDHKFEFKSITHGFCYKGDIYKVTFDDGSHIDITKDHKLFTKDGYKSLKDFVIGEECLKLRRIGTKVILDSRSQVSPVVELKLNYPKSTEWEQVVLGSLLGDGGVYKPYGHKGNPFFSENHCLKQTKYLDWKVNYLSSKLNFHNVKATSGYTGLPLYGQRSGQSKLLVPYEKFKTELNDVQKLGPLGLAIWYQDDGSRQRGGFSLHTECFTLEQQVRLQDVLKSNFDIDVKISNAYHASSGKTYLFLRGDVHNYYKLEQIVKPHIHEDMKYKIRALYEPKCKFCGDVITINDTFDAHATICQKDWCSRYQSLHSSIKVTNIEFLKNDYVYDFTVEDNHNMYANNIFSSNCMDELDVIDNPRVIKEARFIPDTDKEGHFPIAFYTSTRKSGIGPVQAMIDTATADAADGQETTQIRHWNVLDVTEACPKSVNKMNQGKINLYVNRDLFKTITEPEYLAMPEVEQAKWEQKTGYNGCIKCPIFAGCQGNLATKQKSKATSLKQLGVTIRTFTSSDLDDIQAQLMCWKPSSQGLIYPNFDSAKHVIPASKMAKMITGEDYPDTFNKTDLIKLFQKEKARFYSGMDHGYTHPFSVVSGALVGHRLYIFDVIVLAEVELSDQLKHCRAHLPWNPSIFGDTAAPDKNNAFIKDGFHVMNWSKGEVTIGIECVRKKLRPATDAIPELFFLSGDEGVTYLTKEIQKYHWKVDQAGRALDEPVKIHDDACDALRYLCQNLFLNNGMLKVKSAGGSKSQSSYNDFYDAGKILSKEIQNRAADTSNEDERKEIGKRGFKVFLKKR